MKQNSILCIQDFIKIVIAFIDNKQIRSSLLEYITIADTLSFLLFLNMRGSSWYTLWCFLIIHEHMDGNLAISISSNVLTIFYSR